MSLRLWPRLRETRPVSTLLMWLAGLYDRRTPDSCWADTCTHLGLGWDLESFVEDARDPSAERCKADAQRDGRCYCGKFRRIGDELVIVQETTTGDLFAQEGR